MAVDGMEGIRQLEKVKADIPPPPRESGRLSVILSRTVSVVYVMWTVIRREAQE